MVIRLNASDDSDSEMEASSSAQCVFGGLESMIKEARRTVEVRRERTVHYMFVFSFACRSETFYSWEMIQARPRTVPVAEKENNPLRTQDTLPEGTAMEYRLLRAELTR